MSSKRDENKEDLKKRLKELWEEKLEFIKNIEEEEAKKDGKNEFNLMTTLDAWYTLKIAQMQLGLER